MSKPSIWQRFCFPHSSRFQHSLPRRSPIYSTGTQQSGKILKSIGGFPIQCQLTFAPANFHNCVKLPSVAQFAVTAVTTSFIYGSFLKLRSLGRVSGSVTGSRASGVHIAEICHSCVDSTPATGRMNQQDSRRAF